jgi:hypothetical protein
MVMKFRVVKSPEEEARLFEEKQKSAETLFDHLIVQALCFLKHPEYFELLAIYTKNQREPNPDLFLKEMDQYKKLFELGVPSPHDVERLKGAFSMVKMQEEIPARTQDERYLKNILTRLMLRAIVDDKLSVFSELSKISKDLRESANPDVEMFKKLLSPYVKTFDLKVLD